MLRNRILARALSMGAFTLVVAAASGVHAQTWNVQGSTLFANPTSTKIGVGVASATGQMDIVTNQSGRTSLIVNQTTTSGNIVEFHQGSGIGTAKVTIANNGNMGINTTSAPTEKLQIVGNALISGFVRADGGIKIKSNWSMEVPDYVFDETRFKLRRLDELETFVRTNHHLPDVPSASEFQQDGMDVGAMNLVLLKKVEELTLYVIEQDKKIEELSARVAHARKPRGGR